MKLKLTTALLGASALMMSASSFAVVDGIATNGSVAKNLSMNQTYFTMENDADIWMNPAYVVKYKAKAYLEDTQFGGANLETPFGVIGLYLGRTYSGNVASYTNRPGYVGGVITADPGTNLPFGAITALENKFDLFYGMDIGAFDVGLRLNMNGSSETANNPIVAPTTKDDMEVSASQINISAGLRMKDMPLDAGMLFSLKSLTATSALITSTTTDSRTLEGDGSKALSVFARMRLMEEKKSDLFVSVYYSLDDDSRKSVVKESVGSTTTTETMGDSESVMGGMITYNKHMGSTTLMASTGVGLTTTSQSYKSTTDATINSDSTYTEADVVIPFVLAFESRNLMKSKKWTARGSIQRDLGDATAFEVKNNVSSLTSKSSQTNNIITSIRLGAAYQATKNLTIDALVSQAQLYNNANPFTVATGSLLTYFTVSYAM
ncbi:MAG: hypothetical protein OEZ58_10675 [Gammaproteobacteria bacterium]|nr:hypothetical protein [Gammaproteobacteria bacterium]